MFVRVLGWVCLWSAGLAAHDLYLRPKNFQLKPGETLRVEFHNGDSFPRSEVPVKIQRLRDMKLRLANTESAFQDVRIEGTATVADVKAPAGEGTAVLISRTIPNFIELAGPKFEEYLQHEGLDDILAWRKAHGESAKPGREMYSKYVKALALVGKGSKDWGAPAGLAIEFVPLADPYSIKPGGMLPVRVLFQGKPMAGLPIEAASAVRGKAEKKMIGKTDGKGEITIPITRAGLWKLHTIRMERRADTKAADWESYWASLTFEIAATN